MTVAGGDGLLPRAPVSLLLTCSWAPVDGGTASSRNLVHGAHVIINHLAPVLQRTAVGVSSPTPLTTDVHARKDGRRWVGACCSSSDAGARARNASLPHCRGLCCCVCV